MKISPDHMTMTSHSKWRLSLNFLKNNHSFSEYSIFTLIVYVTLHNLICTFFSEQLCVLHLYQIQFSLISLSTYHTWFLMDPPINSGTSVTSGSCISTLPSGLQPCMTSLEACTSWLFGVTQFPSVDT